MYLKTKTFYAPQVLHDAFYQHKIHSTTPLPSLLVALKAAALPRLASVRPPALHLFAAHGRVERNIYTRRCAEAKALGHLLEIQLVNVVDGAQAVAGVGVQVRLEGLLGALLQVVVLADELLELRLHVDDLLGGELELDDGHTCCLEMRQEADFVGLQEQQTAALGVGASGGTTDTVDVVAGVVRGVELDNEIDGRNLQELANVNGHFSCNYLHQDHGQQRQCK
jgi:hypothetical protein